MKITAEQMHAFVGGAGETLAVVLTAAAERWVIDNPSRIAHWMAQMAHEADGFTRTRESLNYSAEALIVRFRGRISEADAFKYGRTPQHQADQLEIANRIYGGEWGKQNLGNTQPGDGWRFIGRGYPGVTGRANYNACSKAVHGDDTLLYRPEFLERPEGAAQAGGWFWHSRNLSVLADADDIHAITMRWTGWDGRGDGAAVGFPQRCERLRRALMIF